MRLLSFCLIGLAFAGAAQAQDAPQPRLAVELNAADDGDDACRLSFLVENSLGADLDEAVFETVIFDATGAVDRLTLFDMRDLPEGRPCVRQFLIDGIACTGIGRILINGAQSCSGAGLPEGACTDNLNLSSRTGIELLG
ncbi:hypothetical protein [Marivita sp. GX14005]|uniref:hypothetical protein n=1 Tax=Marivita sp. GX14005 TaxID=2942276 RepID=UPI002019F2F4|nr:hypothetical protein [Marivita sp. GX14005]MCL3883376.1 hypothetical protein [Marivita sp. GX14005]